MLYPKVNNKPYRKWLRIKTRKYNEWQLNQKWLMFQELKKKPFSWKWLIVGYDLLMDYFYTGSKTSGKKRIKREERQMKKEQEQWKKFISCLLRKGVK